MNISCDDCSSFDVEIEYDVDFEVYKIKCITHDDNNGISIARYTMPEEDLEKLAIYIEHKLNKK